MSKMAELDTDRQQIERLTDVVPPPPFARLSPLRFTITWKSGAYYVDVPNYQGGEVVSAELFDLALKQVQTLKADLNECREYLETEVDVIDGSNGEPMPNRAMTLVCMIDQTLNGRP